MDYNDLIEREKRRRAILVQRLDETDRRIALLNTMSDKADPLDKWLDEQMKAASMSDVAAAVNSIASANAAATATKAAVLTAQESSDGRQTTLKTRDTPRKISSQWVDLIEHLTTDGKQFHDVQAFSARSASPMTPGAIRTGLMNYRKDYGLVSNPKPGFYAATQKGMAFVAEYRNRSFFK